MFIALFAFTTVILVVGASAIASLKTQIDDVEGSVRQGAEILDVLQVDQATALANQASGRERSFAQAAHICANEILDNDRTYALGAFCMAEERMAYFPPEICTEHFPTHDVCGTKYDQPTL